MLVPKSRRHRWMRVWRRDRRAACGLHATGGTVGEWTSRVLVAVSNRRIYMCCVYGRPDVCLLWAMVGDEGQKTARSSSQYFARYKLQDAECTARSKASNEAPVFSDPHLCALGSSRYLVPTSRNDVLTPLLTAKRWQDYLPLSVGSFELEKRRWEKAPFKWLTLSAEKDIVVVVVP